METVKEILQQLNLQKKNFNSSIAEQQLSDKCEKCKGYGYVWEKYGEFPAKCQCLQKQINNTKNEKCKQLFSEAYANYNFENYAVENEFQQKMKNTAIKYINTIGNNSIMFLGQSGAGKSHLCVAIAKELLERGAWIEILSYTEFIIHIKQNMLDKIEYGQMIGKYKMCNILIIDDFLKHTVKNGKVNETDLGIMYEIIDARYRYKKPIILSSEFYIDEMFDINEALAGRLKQMCTYQNQNFIMQIAKDKNRNYRLKGVTRI